ncbi:MAG: hypothetical protein NT157_01520 [Candidatus Micrarchaeota archaeon]|nr:hypothetical protein [Candidatus Micrarchaeota archaeon]
MSEIVANISYAWAIVMVSIIFELIFGLLLSSGSGVVRSNLSGGKLLKKRVAFPMFLVLTVIFGLLDPSKVIGEITNFILSDGNISGGMLWTWLGCMIVSWFYFNKKAGWNPLSLGS